MNIEPRITIVSQEIVSDHELERLTAELTKLLKKNDSHLICQITFPNGWEIGHVDISVKISYKQAGFCKQVYSGKISTNSLKQMVARQEIDKQLEDSIQSGISDLLAEANAKSQVRKFSSRSR